MKRQATGDAIGVHERASATPALPAAVLERDCTHGAVRVPDVLSLREHQECFARVITAPESEPLPIDEASAERLVQPGNTLGALGRLEIYRQSYHARLIECLADDYPVLQYALGDAAFTALCRAYIARHPSSGPNLADFGRYMPAFCCTAELGPIDVQFASELAELEWAIVQSIHSPTAAPLRVEDLRQVAPERWADVRLVANPSLRILPLAFPVNAYLQAHRLGETPEVPARQELRVAVFRTEITVWRMEVTPAMVVLFEALGRGVTLSHALAEVEPLLTDTAGAAEQVMSWFRSGLSSGLFTELVSSA